MSRHVHVLQRSTYVVLDRLDDVVRMLHRPLARHEHVHGDEPLPAADPGLQPVEGHLVGPVWIERGVHRRDVVRGQSGTMEKRM